MKKNKAEVTTKEFDAVKFMRQQRERILNEISNLSPDEIIEYFKKISLKNE